MSDETQRGGFHGEERRFSEWERKEELVLKSLQDLRLSSDSALKGMGDLTTAVVVMKAEMQAKFEQHALATAELKAQIAELKAQRENTNRWLMGLLGTFLLFILKEAFDYIGALAAVVQNAPK